MAGKINEELMRHLDELGGSPGAQEVPIIVTVAEGTESSELEREGFRIMHTLPGISALSGVASPDVIMKLAQMEHVEKIEYDGEMRAVSPYTTP